MASFSDDFNRANGAVGGNWTAVNGGTWAIASNALQQSDVTGAYRGLRWNGGAFDSANFYARVTARAASGVGFGVIVRCPTTGTTSAAIDGYAIVGFVNDQWYRIEFVDGDDAGYIGLGGVVAPNTDYTIEARANGSTITVFVNNSQLAQWTDTTYTTGGAMLVTYGGTVTFDNFEAADLATTVALTLSATGVSATADDADAAVLRALSATTTATTTTTDAVTLNTATAISLTLAAQAATATGDTAAAAILRSLAVDAAPATNTAPTSALALLKALALAAQATTVTSARYGIRFYGNGSGQIDRLRIELDNPADPPIDVGAGDFCYEFWMRCNFADNTSTATDEDARYSNIILDRDIWAHERGWVLGVTRNAGNTALVLCFGVAGAGLSWTTIFGVSNVGDGRWHHIALTRATSTVRLFVDGVQEAIGTYSGDLSYPNGVRPSSGQDNHYLVIGTEKHDVGFGYNGEFAAFRVSNTVRYTTTFIPPRSIGVDGDTVALFLFEEQTGTTAYDTSGLAGAENAELLVGGSPSGPVWTVSESVTLVLVSTVVLAANPVTNTTNAAAAAILRPLIASASVVSSTADTVPVALLRSLPFTISLSSAVAVSSLIVHRSLAINGFASTDTAQGALSVLRALDAAIAATSETANDGAMSILRAIVQQAVVDTETSDNTTLNLSVVVQAVLAATAGTEASAPALAILRSIAQQAQAVTDTPAIDLGILRLLLVSSQAATATAEAQIAILRAIVAGATAGTLTSDVTLNLAAVIAAMMAATVGSDTAEVNATVLRSMAAQIAGDTATAGAIVSVLRLLAVEAGAQSDTAEAQTAILRALAAMVEAGTQTNVITLNLAAVLALALAATGVTETAESSVTVLRSASAQVAIDTETAEAIVGILRGLIVDVGAQSKTAEALVAVQRVLYHNSVASTATGEIDFRTEAIVGLLRLIVSGALHPAVTASGRRPFIKVGE